LQLAIIGFVSLAILLAKWKDLMAAFFDEAHARSIGLRPGLLRLMFFTLLSASCVAALQTVGAFLVIAMVVTPGATAYLLTDRFPRLLALSVAIGTLTCFLGAYLSFFLDGATGGVIICLQTLIFLLGLHLRAKARLPCRPPPRGPGTGGVMDWLPAPFHFPFMQNAFLAAALIAPPTALLSCLLVLKGWSLMGDAISHATLPGIVIAYVAGVPLVLGAFAAGMACALAVGFLGDNSRVKRDTVMGVVFSGMFGLGIVLYTGPTDLHLDHILFGNILGIGPADLITAAAVALVVTAALLAKRRDLMLCAFDAAQAGALGLPVKALHYGLLALISLTIVATLKSVGLILAIGLLIAPGAIAFLLTRRFDAMLAVAVAVTLAAMVGGVWLSFHLNSAPAPTIILLLTAAFLLAFAEVLPSLYRWGDTEEQAPHARHQCRDLVCRRWLRSRRRRASMAAASRAKASCAAFSPMAMSGEFVSWPMPTTIMPPLPISRVRRASPDPCARSGLHLRRPLAPVEVVFYPAPLSPPNAGAVRRMAGRRLGAVWHHPHHRDPP
jgi:manganese/iron transport system permease protein